MAGSICEFFSNQGQQLKLALALPSAAVQGLLSLSDAVAGSAEASLDLAASLIGHPAVLFLDEPTTGLDPSARALMWDIVRQLVADGTTLLLTTQYLDEADQLAGRIAVIDGGKVIAEGTPGELKASLGGQRLLGLATDVVRALDAAGVKVTDIAVRGASLDDVFLTLTGHMAEEDAQAGTSEEVAVG
jgi:oleandomycin transport system ATP-binding protein